MRAMITVRWRPVRIPVPAARSGSWEDLLHRAGAVNKLLLLDDQTPQVREPRGHRAIGVVYDPERERTGNYVPTILPYCYDVFLFIDQTRPLHPLHVPARPDGEPPETYPWAI
ncbi:MAG: erythromycin esterase family protein [Dehalococcoidia bacterium]